MELNYDTNMAKIMTDMLEAEATEQEGRRYYPSNVGKSTGIDPALMAKYLDWYNSKPASKHAAARAERAKHRKNKKRK
ncbi:hypothetical protein Xoosp13_48 [Xanthomonas phage Xoo-sp13]|nr:hypothetical protein Xoosp13_48 [Xanthomonas phage Xoo-sp13]